MAKPHEKDERAGYYLAGVNHMSKNFKSTLGNIIKNELEGFSSIKDDVKIAEKRNNKIFLAASAGKRKQVTVLSVDPKRCRLWEFHNRMQEFLNEETCKDLIDSIKAKGQEQPALVRELHNNTDYDYEVIYGSRRRFACEYLGRDLEVALTDRDNKECAAIMDIENRARKDISDYERAHDYKNWVEKGLYKSYEELAKNIGVSKGYLSKITKLAQLPTQIVDAFNSPFDLKPYYAIEIIKLLNNSDIKQKILRKARELKLQKLDAIKTFRAILKVGELGNKIKENKQLKDIEVKSFPKGHVIRINRKLSQDKLNLMVETIQGIIK
jgi:ParB family chromosome partitioning protein